MTRQPLKIIRQLTRILPIAYQRLVALLTQTVRRARLRLQAIAGTPEPGTLIECCIALFRGHYVVASLAIGLGVFLVGLIIAARIGFAEIYLDTLPVYMGVFGIVWVFWWIAWATRRLREMMEQLQPLFLVPSAEYRTGVQHSVRWAFDWPLQLRGSLLLWMIGIGTVVAFTRYGLLVWFPSAWSLSPSLFLKNLILILFDIPIAVLLFASGTGIVSYTAFVRHIASLPLVPHVGIARAKLRRVANFGIATGLAWSIGVSLFIVLFRIQYTLPAVGAVLTLTAFGLVLFAWPQYAIHVALERTRQEVLDEAITRLVAPLDLTQATGSRALLRAHVPAPSEAFQQLLADAVSGTTWTYNLSDVASILGTWLLPLLPLVLNQSASSP